jgi:regulator of sigma E protease
MTLHVTRVDSETKVSTDHDIELDVSYGKRFGLVFAMGPVVCIQRASIAEQAGLQVGDVITAMDGQPVGDPLTLSNRMLNHVGKTTQITVQRGDAKVDLSLTPRSPRMDDSPRRRDAPLGLDSLGIGFVMHSTVAAVVPDSPAAKAGIRPGDVVHSAQLLVPFAPTAEDERMPWLLGDWQDHRKKNQLQRTLQAYELDRPLAIDNENNNWPYVVGIDGMLADPSGDEPYQVELNYERGGEALVARLQFAESDTVLDPLRGFQLAAYEETRTASSWSEAMHLGTREVWEGMKQVVVVLRKITSNYQNLGGPLTIAAVATMEADEGLPRLLIFLTLLSANLAVLNFLPIPVLDGGHMVFLAYEGIVGKPVNERVQMSLTLLGFSFLMCLMIFVFGLDLTRFLG